MRDNCTGESPNPRHALQEWRVSLCGVQPLRYSCYCSITELLLMDAARISPLENDYYMNIVVLVVFITLHASLYLVRAVVVSDNILIEPFWQHHP